MLPRPTAEELEAQARRNQRRLAARHAYNRLALSAHQDTGLRMAIGTLPRLWWALAVDGKLEQHVAEAQAKLETLPPDTRPYERERAQRCCEGLQQFNQSFRVALDGVH